MGRVYRRRYRARVTSSAATAPSVTHVTVDDGTRLPIVCWPAREDGRAEETGVLLLHGLSQQARFWGPVARRMTAGPVAAMDQRCHGYSEAAADCDVSIDRCARDSLAAVAALGWQRAVVVGHSWGASVALRSAARDPERVPAAVLLDGGLWRLPGDRDEIRTRLRPPALGIPLADLQRLIEADSVIPWDAERRAALADTYIVDAQGRARTRIGVDRHMRVLDGLLDYDPAPDLQSAATRLWPVVCEPEGHPPTSGPIDPWTQARATAVAAAGELRGIRLQRWQGAVHDVPLQWPALVAGLIDTVHESALATNGDG